jgi:tripeptidyl-peptidase I
MFAPPRHTVERVEVWLIDSGISRDRISHAAGRNWVKFNATVEEIESLFNTEYHVYEHQNGGIRIACDEYHLPEHVREHIDFAMPTIHLEGMVPQRRIMTEIQAKTNLTGLTGLQHCNTFVTIECQRALYGFGAGNTSHPKNTIGIGEWADFLESDISPFY